MLSRENRARLALEGLSVGDAFGERFFGAPDVIVPLIESRAVPAAPWRYTDDTEMAISIVEQLEDRGAIDQDDLGARFARRMELARGYGQGAYEILNGIREGRAWRALSRNAFRGKGSFGNGAAMRAAPLGAFFADDLERVAREAAAASEVTHAHTEGVAGGIAIAIAAALCATTENVDGKVFLEAVLGHTPRGYTYDGIKEALALPENCSTVGAAKILGNGAGVTAPDTVPFCLWIIARHLGGSYEEALWATVSALGDRDTTCAIVGGVVVLRGGVESIPSAWQAAREPLPI